MLRAPSSSSQRNRASHRRLWTRVRHLPPSGWPSIPSQPLALCAVLPPILLPTPLTCPPQVFTNKAIFSDPSLKLAQLTFAAFHFFITWLALFVLSRPQFAMFAPRKVAISQLVPLAIAMCLNVILTNLSLAYSTVTFYQVARILLTPTVAVMNFVLYRSTLPRNALYALVPACLGVAMVSYYDSRPSKSASIKTTSTLGVVFAFLGILASSLYTVWISSYHKKLKMNSMQLLFNQAPLAAFMLLYAIPIADTFPVWKEVPVDKWVLIMMVRLPLLWIRGLAPRNA
jgi:solute carrier family 35 protein E3